MHIARTEEGVACIARTEEGVVRRAGTEEGVVCIAGTEESMLCIAGLQPVHVSGMHCHPTENTIIELCVCVIHTSPQQPGIWMELEVN